MTWLLVFASILAALFLTSLIRVGGIVEFSGEGLSVRGKLGPFRFAIFPSKQKKAREKTEKKAPVEPPSKPGGSLTMFKKFLPLLADAAGRLRRKVRVERICLDFIAAAEGDPAFAAMSYGYGNAAIGMIWPLIENNFNIQDRRIRTAVDFNAAQPTVYLYAAASLSVGQAAALAVHLGIGLFVQTKDGT